MTPVVILGCGYTGRVVAKLLSDRGVPVVATTRHPCQLTIPGVQTVRFDADETTDVTFVPHGARAVYSIPTVPNTEAVLAALASRVSRLVYISTTGVYGATEAVDHTTPVAPRSDEGRARIRAEQIAALLCRNTVVLRAAAIYGPGRGVHVRIAEGTFRLAGDGGNYVSRIHVADLAAHVEAALDSDLTGAWPVGDELPCTSREIAEYCAELLGVPVPGGVDPASLHPTRRANRRIVGSAIRNALGVRLRYPTYRVGIPASLANAS